MIHRLMLKYRFYIEITGKFRFYIEITGKYRMYIEITGKFRFYIESYQILPQLKSFRVVLMYGN